jgi:hypothetical protein
MSGKSIAYTAVIALVVVAAYDAYKGKVPATLRRAP